MANYVSTHTGEQIDEAVDKVLPLVSTAQQIDETVNKTAFASNDNVLDNGTFIINQRGSTSYTASGYTVDRWRTTGGTVTVDDDGITWQNATASTTLYLSQYFERLEGGMYTLSIKLKNGNIYTANGEIPATLPTSGTTYYISIDPSDSAFRRLNLAYNATTKLWVVQLSILAGTNVDVKAIKLEQGTVNTISNEKNANYAEELCKCQRYCYVVETQGTFVFPIGSGFASSATEARISINIPTSMRNTPTADFENADVTIRGNGVSVTPTAYTVAAGKSRVLNQIYLRCTASGLTALNAYELALSGKSSNGARLILSADL